MVLKVCGIIRSGVWLSLARAPGLGPGGRRFESCHPDLIMREWLSWWSTTLPRLGSRVRVPSRALNNKKKDIRFWISFFLLFEPCRTRTFEVYAPLRSLQSERPLDVLQRLALFFFGAEALIFYKGFRIFCVCIFCRQFVGTCLQLL